MDWVGDEGQDDRLVSVASLPSAAKRSEPSLYFPHNCPWSVDKQGPSSTVQEWGAARLLCPSTEGVGPVTLSVTEKDIRFLLLISANPWLGGKAQPWKMCLSRWCSAQEKANSCQGCIIEQRTRTFTGFLQELDVRPWLGWSLPEALLDSEPRLSLSTEEKPLCSSDVPGWVLRDVKSRGHQEWSVGERGLQLDLSFEPQTA